jgi:DNA-binding GntR family transcriptional regulator
LIAILSYYNTGYGYSYPTQKRLMADTCIKDRKTLAKAIKELEEEGYIRKQTIKGKGNKYFIK